MGLTLIWDLGAGGRWIRFYLIIFYNPIIPISNLPQNEMWLAQFRVRAVTPILHLVDAPTFLYCTNLKRKGCSEGICIGRKTDAININVVATQLIERASYCVCFPNTYYRNVSLHKAIRSQPRVNQEGGRNCAWLNALQSLGV